ncbi:MAG: aldo/keto reductase [Clostridiales bacterium]|jgi:predicted aldo/keto reductase-like oxidoreductase|nr:aldo/keto reductase [Clostridiales bacterium]
MIKREFKGNMASWLGMGNMRLPVIEGQGGGIDRKKAQEIIDFAMQNGVNYFDTAYGYHSGESEDFLGEALANYPRESYFLATKYLILMNPDYKAVFEEQLAKLRTDYIDYYLCHAVFDHTFQQYIDSGCIEFFAEQKAKGRIGHLGFSIHASIENFQTFLNYHDWDFVLMQLNAYDWDYGLSKQMYEILGARGIPSVAMGPVRGGRIANLSPDAEKILRAARPDWELPEWALRWAKNRENNRVVLSGMSTLAQIQDNVRIFSDEIGLSEAEEALFHEALAIFKKDMQVPCTDCKYCTDNENCPVSINIPRFLEVYNTFKVDGPFALRKLKEVESAGRPADCIDCKVCTTNCPQNIEIPTIMRELAGHDNNKE